MVTPITHLELQTTRGVQCRLEYEHGPACGFDRTRLDGALLGLARDAGAHVLTGTVVRTVELPEFRGRRGPAAACRRVPPPQQRKVRPRLSRRAW